VEYWHSFAASTYRLQLPLQGIDLLLQLGVVGEGGRGNQDGRPEHRSSQQ
jgi:hypothetical protein